MENKKKTLSIAFTGDIGFDKHMDGRWVDENLLSREICDFLYSADHVVANVEGALYQPECLDGKPVTFHAMNPQAVCALKRMQADIWDICNNHIMDAGVEGLVSTQEIAKAAGCRTLGAGLNEAEATKPICVDDMVGLIAVGYHTDCIPATENTAGCFCWDDFALIEKRITQIKEKCRWCVVVVHGGEEFTALPLPYTRDRYMKFLALGADVVVGHHPHVPENYEVFDDGKMIFYSLGNFIFDTNYQRAHAYTDTGVLLKLIFSKDKIGFEAIGTKIDRVNERIEAASLPVIFTDIPAAEYELLAPLGAKSYVEEEKRKMIFMEPETYKDPEAFKAYFAGDTHESYVKGSHLDFAIIVPVAEKAENGQWQNSTLEDVKNYILKLI
jgi:poly-gamma-glutamate synthesis protein (capsule biosynthesis protein)